ncbi:MAG: site-specific DNA-methyltransferase [Tannerella sp.]|jgi:adenine-specific DNA-methyltransferase|nr:site-specific DNA-methyltransferase [Tannerella sp.]
MDGLSYDIRQNSVETLHELFPNIFSEGKIDLEKFKTVFSDKIDFHNERYTLNWAGKADVFKALQERTSATLTPQPELSVHFGAAENVFIEGENLEVLKVLQKSYYNKIKCIIIDPPYNTGNDSFIYPDRFKENLEDYEKRAGEKDEEGYMIREGLFRKNSRENGHYHSNWLNMMLPRLFLARSLLRDDGVIFVHIDDNEVHNLRLLMNEIFGEENFCTQFVWQARQSIQNDTDISESHEYILVYARIRRAENRRLKDSNASNWFNEKSFAFYPKDVDEEKFQNLDNDPRGKWKADPFDAPNIRPNLTYEIINPKTRDKFLPPQGRHWRTTESEFKKLLNDNRIVFGKSGTGKPQLKVFYNEKKDYGSTIDTWLDGNTYGTATKGTKTVQALFDGVAPFDTPKPTELILNLLKFSTKKEDLILDFFAGSGSTAQAVLELNQEDGGNRKYILVQLAEPCDENSEAYKAGYKTIVDISRERIRRVIQKIEKECKEEEAKNGMFKEECSPSPWGRAGERLGFKSFKLSPSNFKVWRGEEITEENLEQQMELFIDPVKPESKTENMLTELMLKSSYQLTDKVENKGHFYSVNDNKLIIALTKMDLDIAAEIISLLPKKVVALDRLFKGGDELKTNTALQMRDAGVEFKTI